MTVVDVSARKLEDHLSEIEEVISSHRIVLDRVVSLVNKGYHVMTCSMGSGGVGRVKRMHDGTVRTQISYGRGRYNYAYVVVLYPSGDDRFVK